MDLVRAALLGCLLFALAPSALAARLELPLRVPLELVREALAKQLAASAGKNGELWREGACGFLSLEPPKLDAAAQGRLRLVAPGKAMLGLEVLGKCANAADWVGTAQFTLAPRIDRAGVLRVHIVDSSLTDTRGAGGQERAAAMIWELAKRQLHPRLERFSYDLGASRAALLGILRGIAPPAQTAAMEAALAQLQVLEPRVEKTHIVVPIAMEIPEAWLATPAAAPAATASGAPLTEAEIEVLERALEPLDAFLVYSIRQIAADSTSAELRQRLFTLLLDSRYELSAILSGDAPAGGDPVRALFIDTWNQLRGILADAQRAGSLDPSLLRYALFIHTGDALLALEQAAPNLGLRLTADGLRQLARSLRPAETGDPLAYSWAVDPQLLDLFRVEALPEAPPEKTSSASFFLKTSDAPPAKPKPLDHWVPSRSELSAYQARIGALLKKTAASELQRSPLSPPHDRMFTSLVPTTALIESCWRQYIVRAGKVTYLRSASRSVGIMQINQHVWRGFYDVQRLRWDTAYNTRAGTQILLRYVKDYAIPYAKKSGKPTDIPRAAYAVYNAGPRAVARFAKSPPHPREARVDEKLWTLYQAVASGGKPDLKSCGVKDSG
jgi:hypothetical protein